MIKYDTIGMIEHSEKNFPYIKAHVNMPFYSIVTADFANNVSAWPTATTKMTDGLYLVDNTRVGDWFAEPIYTWDNDSIVGQPYVREGHMLRLSSLKALDQQFLVIDEKHITYVAPADYSTIVPGTTMLGVGEDGNFEIIGSNAGRAIYFLVTQKTTLTEKAVRARVIVQDL